MNNWIKSAIYIGSGILLGQIAWNYSISPVFGLPQIDFLQMVGIMFFIFLVRPTTNVKVSK